MGDRLVTDIRNEDVRRPQANKVVAAVLSDRPVDLATQPDGDLRAVVDAPFVRLIRPLEAKRRAVDIRTIPRAPGPASAKRGNVRDCPYQDTRPSLRLRMAIQKDRGSQQGLS